MGVNATELINNPWETIFSPFEDIIPGFWLIPIGVIAVALFIKTRSITVSSIWLFASCIMLGSGNLFVNNPEIAFVYFLFAVFGFIGVIVSLYTNVRRY